MDEHEVKRRFDRLDTRLAEIDARLDKMDERFGEMQRLILDAGERTRHHFDEVVEGLDGQSPIELRVIGIESRAGGIEKVQKVVLTEIRGLATKVDRLTRLRRGRPGP